MRTSIGRRRVAFTLVELLVVISIIALLVAILLPSLQTARKQAKAVICQTRIKALSTGAWTYATEWGVYPPSLSNFADSTTSSIRAMSGWGGMDWLGVGDGPGGDGSTFDAGLRNDPRTGNPEGFAAAPRFGALWPYVKDEEAYLCPSDKPGKPGDAQNYADDPEGGPGNGKYSYSIFSNLGCLSPERIPSRERAASGGSRGGSTPGKRLSRRPAAGVPIFVEEHPAGLNGGNMEGNFNFSTDYVVARHTPFGKRRAAIGSNDNAKIEQGASNIGFGDGHVEPVKVNWGFTSQHVKPTAAGGRGLEGIPYTAEGLLYYYGIEYDPIAIEP